MKSRVFLSYSIADKHFADQIQEAFNLANVPISIAPFGPSSGDSVSSSISRAISASDFIILLVSPDALKSQWMMPELEALTSQEWQQRAITVIPVKVRPCIVPQYLARWHILDLTQSPIRGIQRLVSMVRVAPRIDLSLLTPAEFEQLVYELLRAYGFRRIRGVGAFQDKGSDFIAEHSSRDPFGRETKEQWIVQAKATRNKTDISALQSFIGSASWRNERLSALFVTSTQLTSAAKEWISSLQRQNAPQLIVLEGTDITRLLLTKPKVAERFFPG